jgi:uncharacterized membrane protein YgdD (TMEM256/DUF423 family)
VDAQPNLSRRLVFIGSILTAVGVAIGALGAHGLPDWLKKKGFDEAKIEKRLEQCETGVKYHLFHGLSVVVIGLSPLSGRAPRSAAWLMILGVFLFSGGIYGIVFAEAATHWLVPFGGIAFVVGWIVLAGGCWRATPK